MLSYIRKLLPAIVLLLTATASYSQDTLVATYIQFTDTAWIFGTSAMSVSSYHIYHNPTKEDSAFYKKHRKLVNAKPTKKNYRDYYSLAYVLWQMDKAVEAEKMFLAIVDSKEPYYEGTYYHSSDVPGDTATNTYGYGSYTSNYKNYMCRNLTELYIQQKQYRKALKYLELADKKYTIEYTCGTGYMMYHNELNELYGVCYEGSGRYEDVIDMWLPLYYEWKIGSLIDALKKTYTQKQINEYLEEAERSITCIVDSFQSVSYITENWGKPNEKTTEIKYTLGTGTVMLFGRKIELEIPRDLKAGEVVSRERFVKEFKASGFYNALASSAE